MTEEERQQAADLGLAALAELDPAAFERAKASAGRYRDRRPRDFAPAVEPDLCLHLDREQGE